jgi:hypothetical protein
VLARARAAAGVGRGEGEGCAMHRRGRRADRVGRLGMSWAVVGQLGRYSAFFLFLLIP